MKILILKNKKAFDDISRNKLVECFFAGYWVGDIFKVEKDRLCGNRNIEFDSVQLVKYINKLQKILATPTKSLKQEEIPI